MWQLALDLLGASPTLPAPPDVKTGYTHPRANRRALLVGVLVEYELRRGRRRTIGFAVDAEGLTVRVPRRMPQAEIDAALREKTHWITTRLMQARERAIQLAAARIDWRSGAVVPYLGAALALAADPGAPKSRGRAASAVPVAMSGAGQPQTLCLPLPLDATPAQWRDATAAWLMRQARRLFTERLDYYAPQLGVRWQRLSLSSAQTRWGSAGSAGWIRLNWRLIHLSLPVIDYVAVHELAHLREMNHGPRFWTLVETVLPDYAACRAALRDAVVPGF